MNSHFTKINQIPRKPFIISLLLCLSPLSNAEDALMQPVQAVHYQELPPPWTTQATPVIAAITPSTKTNKSNITTSARTKPVVKKAPLPVAMPFTTPQQKKVQTAKAIKAASTVSPIQSLITRANQNDNDAQYNLGMRYQYGNGVEKSRSKAHRWLNKSAESGNPRAQYALSMFYQQFARNQAGAKKALLWLKRAADQGLADAQYSLGMMFKNGSLVYPNQAESQKWLKMAAAQGHTSAQLALQ